MTYRDERDALRGRIQGLEQDLDDARRSQKTDEEKRARIEQIEGRMREAEQDLKAAREELAKLRPAPPAQRRSPVAPFVVGIGALVSITAGAVAFLVARAPAPSHVVVVAPAPVEPPTAVTAPVPAPEPSPAEAEPQPPEQGRFLAARWQGKVVRATGYDMKPGAPCDVDATLENKAGKPRVAELSVMCGGRHVYRSTDKLEGMSMYGSGFAEEPGKEAGTFTYAMRYSDTGARSGPRTQISLDSTQGQGAVWSDVVPIFRVEFKLPTLSAPVRGDRLLPPAPAKDVSEDPR